MQLAHPGGQLVRLAERRRRLAKHASPEGDVAKDVEGGQAGRDAAATVGQGAAGDRIRLGPATRRPQDVGEVGGHVVPVVPALDALRVGDALTEPRLAPLVFDEHRGGGPEHAVRPCDRHLVPGFLGAGQCVQHQVPALVHAAGEQVTRAERRGGVVLRHGIAEPRGDAPRILGQGDPLLQATVEHVGRRECREQPGSDALRFLVDRWTVE